jgi:hypothetical protein
MEKENLWVVEAMAKIDLFVYSYKNKNLKLVVETAINNCTSDINVTIKDQHPLDRSSLFTDSRISYNHEFWDHIYSPILFKKEYAHKATGDYYGILSDDILLAPGWNEAAESLASDGVVVSGMGKYSIDQSDPFLIKIKKMSNESGITNLLDRHFVFGKTSVMSLHDYPDYLKFNGEDVASSLEFFLDGVQIHSLPSGTYSELGNNTFTNTYVPFSLQHGYNRLVRVLNGKEPLRPKQKSVSDFIAFHKIDLDKLREFPHQYDDVSYDPNNFLIETSNVGGKRFSNGLKSIH